MLMLTQDQLEELIRRVKAMYPQTHAPADGRGCYLGTGYTPPVRSQDLLSALVELRDLRSSTSKETP